MVCCPGRRQWQEEMWRKEGLCGDPAPRGSDDQVCVCVCWLVGWLWGFVHVYDRLRRGALPPCKVYSCVEEMAQPSEGLQGRLACSAPGLCLTWLHDGSVPGPGEPPPREAPGDLHQYSGEDSQGRARRGPARGRARCEHCGRGRGRGGRGSGPVGRAEGGGRGWGRGGPAQEPEGRTRCLPPPSVAPVSLKASYSLFPHMQKGRTVAPFAGWLADEVGQQIKHLVGTQWGAAEEELVVIKGFQLTNNLVCKRSFL